MGSFSASMPIKQKTEEFAGSVSQAKKSKCKEILLFTAYNHPKVIKVPQEIIEVELKKVREIFLKA